MNTVKVTPKQPQNAVSHKPQITILWHDCFSQGACNFLGVLSSFRKILGSETYMLENLLFL